jgi:DinB superfamily
VNHEKCVECGFDGASFDDDALLDAVTSLGSRWRALMATAGSELRTRPAPEVWSALEYAAHSRDITALHAFGVDQALTVDEPVFPAIEPGIADKAATHYDEEDVDAVLDRLDAEAQRLAGLARDAAPSGWSRGLTIGGDRQDVRHLVEHALHDSTHHLRDVENGFARLGAGNH